MRAINATAAWHYENVRWNFSNAPKSLTLSFLNFLQQYMDNYCDAAGELYDVFEAQGCKMFGLTDSTTGYEHQTSKADRAGKFVGLMCDEDNQYDLSEDRAKAWVAQLKEEGFF